MRREGNIDDLIKLKAKEEPSEEYWNSYWSRLEGKLGRTSAREQLNSFPSRDRNLSHAFMPRMKLALNVVLVVLLILTGSRLYQNTQQMKSLRIALSERQEKTGYYETTTKVLLPATSKQAIEGAIRKQVKLFNGIKEMFPHTIKWVVTNNGRIDMGIASPGAIEKTVTRKQEPVFLQFEILCTSPVSEIVSSPKIMVLSGNGVNVKLVGLSKADETIYRYHCFPVLKPDGEVDLAIRISLDNSVLDTSLIVNEGRRTKLGSLSKGNAEYSIYVTVRSKGLNMVETESRGI